MNCIELFQITKLITNCSFNRHLSAFAIEFLSIIEEGKGNEETFLEKVLPYCLNYDKFNIFCFSAYLGNPVFYTIENEVNLTTLEYNNFIKICFLGYVREKNSPESKKIILEITKKYISQLEEDLIFYSLFYLAPTEEFFECFIEKLKRIPANIFMEIVLSPTHSFLMSSLEDIARKNFKRLLKFGTALEYRVYEEKQLTTFFSRDIKILEKIFDCQNFNHVRAIQNMILSNSISTENMVISGDPTRVFIENYLEEYPTLEIKSFNLNFNKKIKFLEKEIEKIMTNLDFDSNIPEISQVRTVLMQIYRADINRLSSRKLKF